MAGERARPLTEAERRLWSRLRTHRAFRGDFQRDVSVGHYVVDFASPRAKLVVEVDDGQITGRRTAEIRAIYLNALGWRVLRVWHSDIDRRPDAILHTISEAVNAAAPAPPATGDELPSPVAKAEKKKIAKRRTVAKNKKKKRKPRRQSRKKG